ncbi:MAG TPA: type 2 lanthipeptide synthetase LanM family protein [Candidatus Angelobacter sp.]
MPSYPLNVLPISRSILDSAVWRQASTLMERLPELRRPKTQIPIDPELAAESLALWRASSPFDQDRYFFERLAMDGITQEEFTQVLGTPVEKLDGHGAAPPWAEWLACAYSSPPKPREGGRENWGDVRNATTAGFLNLVEPLMIDARCALESRVKNLTRDHHEAPIDMARTIDALFANLPRQLFAIIQKTMVLELNTARLEGVLTGATPPERFTSFTQRLRRPDVALGLLSEYPVLARRIVGCIDNWVSVSSEFLQHLAADWTKIKQLFNLDSQTGILVEAAGGAGDTHRQGRSVVVARFADGSRLVYKPRSMAVDAHFQDFIRWVNEKGANPQLRTLKVLDGEDHGWVEFAHTEGCASREEVVRFYERLGEYLAILYILEATDFHFENLLACGEHPIPVDLEALFHPWVRGIDLKQPDIQMVSLAKARSVLRIGVLPRRLWAHEDYSGVDLSGLGGAPGQLSDNILQWAGAGTDEMAAVKQPFRMPGGRNRPTINGAEVDVQQYAEPIISGFSRMYELLRSHRDELLSSHGPLERFAHDEVRVVVRATRGYGMLLSQSLHPDYLRDALELDRLLDGLWAGVEDNAHLLRLIPSERRDLLAGDVPIFSTRPASRDLFTSTGDKIDAFFEKTAMDLSREHVLGLSDEDHRRQTWFIRASIATLDLGEEEMKWASYQPIWSSSPCSRSELRPKLIAEACRIGDRLAELSLQDGPHVTWIGFAYLNKVWSLDALLEDLYGGSTGLILALAYLGSFGFDQYTELARRALKTLQVRLESTGQYLHSIGAFSGWGGIIYVLSHLGVLWNDPELFAYAHRLVERLPDLIEKDEALDLVGGCAGCIGSLLALHKASPSDQVLAACVQCGERLLARAKRMENSSGLGWITNLETAEPMTGFAHGSAGISWALLELAAQTGNQNYRTTALEAIVYESSRYSSQAGNWVDAASTRELGVRKAIAPSMAWCYGAPGIGMARAAALKHTDHPLVLLDLERALQATISHGPGTNHSLCHGDLGNLDFLLQASQATGSQELVQRVDELENQIIAGMKKYGWLCGVPLGVESPALMNGLAGLCYGLLRLADPDRVPSVLTLSSPSMKVSSIER